jgi:Domain of unknown function (DUF4260)
MIGLQRAEGLALALAGLAAFWVSGESWWLFAALILVPDISFAGYLAGPVIGAHVYNALHSLVGPALLFAVATLGGWQIALAASLVWIVHIGTDRALGYGLKLTTGFRDTHLGRIGRD